MLPWFACKQYTVPVLQAYTQNLVHYEIADWHNENSHCLPTASPLSFFHFTLLPLLAEVDYAQASSIQDKDSIKES